MKALSIVFPNVPELSLWHDNTINRSLWLLFHLANQNQKIDVEYTETSSKSCRKFEINKDKAPWPRN